jgi:glucose/arabinose dehydrogenase
MLAPYILRKQKMYTWGYLPFVSLMCAYTIIPLKLVTILLTLMLIFVIIGYCSSPTTQVSTYAQVPPPPANATLESSGPYLRDSSLAVQTVITGLNAPTDMAFLSDDDILVLERNTGTVRRVVNGTLLKDPLLDVAVATKDERGMLGIAIAESIGHTYVFLYYTEARGGDGEDLSGIEPPLGNRLYRYELENSNNNNNNSSKLVNGKLLLDLPAAASHHNGGKIKIGPDNNVYLVVGDQQEPVQEELLTHLTTTQNVPKGLSPDGTAGILRLTQDGRPIQNLLGSTDPVLDLYYAYGIRNSFGIDFDPVTGNLWDTEIGPDKDDEVNLVEPGFNSGWRKIQGLAGSNSEISDLVEFPGISGRRYSIVGLIEELSFRIQGLGGKYSDPEFVWHTPIAPTAIEFLDSKKLGGKYQNDIFVGSFNYGRIIHFHLNEQRNGLYLRGPLEDRVEHNPQGYGAVVFGRNFGRIVDLETGPDGYLYVLSLAPDGGKIYRILPKIDPISTIP